MSSRARCEATPSTTSILAAGVPTARRFTLRSPSHRSDRDLARSSAPPRSPGTSPSVSSFSNRSKQTVGTSLLPRPRPGWAASKSTSLPARSPAPMSCAGYSASRWVGQPASNWTTSTPTIVTGFVGWSRWRWPVASKSKPHIASCDRPAKCDGFCRRPPLVGDPTRSRSRGRCSTSPSATKPSCRSSIRQLTIRSLNFPIGPVSTTAWSRRCCSPRSIIWWR